MVPSALNRIITVPVSGALSSAHHGFDHRKPSAFHRRVPCAASRPFLNHVQVALSSPVLRDYGPVMGSFVPVGVAILSCKRLNMGSEKDLAVAVSRCCLQLVILSFALKFVFEGEKIMASAMAVVFMVVIAGLTAGGRAKELPKSRIIATGSLAFGTLGVLGLMIFLQACPVTPRYIIPTAGYVIGGAMSMVGATMKELRKDMVLHRGQIEAALALGGTPWQAAESYIRRGVKQGMTPWIDSIKAAGLITIPGSMTGLLLVGMRPMEVVRIQIQLLYMLLGAAAISSTISSYFSYRVLFSKNCQLAIGEA